MDDREYRTQVLVLVLIFFKVSVVVSGTSCESPLGMGSGEIPNGNIGGSESWTNYEPYKARINTTDNGWIANSYSGDAYITVDFGGIMEVTSFEIQGVGVYGYFTSSFRVYYSLDNLVWRSYTSLKTSGIHGEILNGNTNSGEIVKVSLNPSIKARHIAINPVTWRARAGLRLEIYGCSAVPDLPLVVTNVTSDIEITQTWIPSQSPYVIDRMIHVRPSKTLTILAGTKVVFTTESAGITVHGLGKLDVQGLNGAQSLFTSSIVPSMKSQWYGIEVLDGGTLNLAGSVIRQGRTCVSFTGIFKSAVQSTLIYNCITAILVETQGLNEMENKTYVFNNTRLLNNNDGIIVKVGSGIPHVSFIDSELNDNMKSGMRIDNNKGLHMYMRDTQIKGNKQYGLYLRNTNTDMIFDRCNFSLNKYGFYSSGYRTENNLTFLSSSFFGNANTGIFLQSSRHNVTIDRSQFITNHRGSIYCDCYNGFSTMHSLLNISNSVFRDQTYDYQPYVFLRSCYDSTLFVKANAFSNTHRTLFFDNYYSNGLTSTYSIYNNTFTECKSAYAISANKGTFHIMNNTFINSTCDSVIDLKEGFNHTINYNMFLNPASKYDLRTRQPYKDSFTINATFNFWGDAVKEIITTRICDFFCDLKFARVTVVPLFVSEYLLSVKEDMEWDSFEVTDDTIGGVVSKDVQLDGNKTWIVARTILVQDGATFTVPGNTSFMFSQDRGIYLKRGGRMKTDTKEATATFTKNGYNQWAGIYCVGGNDITFSGLNISNALYGLYVTESLGNATVQLKDSKFTDCSNGLKLNAGHIAAINIDNVTFTKSTTAAIDIQMNAGSNVILKVTKSDFLSVGNGININDVSGSGTNARHMDMNISDSNNFTDIRSTALRISSCYTSLNLFVFANHFIKSKNTMNIEYRSIRGTISSNQIADSRSGVYIRPCYSEGKDGHIGIVNNTFVNTYSKYDLEITSNYRGVSNNYSISDNSFLRTIFPTYGYNSGAIYLRLNVEDSNDITIKGNVFLSKGGTALYVSSRYRSLHVLNNEFRNGTTALVVESRGLQSVSKGYIIKNNTFLDNTGKNVIQLTPYGPRPIEFTENRLFNNTGQIINLRDINISIHYNFFENPNSEYNVKFESSRSYSGKSVNASLNFWGTQRIADIKRKILDANYNINYPTIIWQPFLSSRNYEDLEFGVETFFVSEREIGGKVEGNVTLSVSDSPYTVSSNILIQHNDILWIEAGVSLFFLEGVSIFVEGSLQVLGSSSYPVTLIPETVGKKWGGIKFQQEYKKTEITDIRLEGMNSESEGRVEVLINGTYGTLCKYSYMTGVTANVVCRMLGYNPNDGAEIIDASSVPDGTGPIYFHNVNCDGTERTLFECRFNAFTNCRHRHDIGVRCLGKKIRNTTDVRMPSRLQHMVVNDTLAGLILGGDIDVVSNVRSMYSSEFGVTLRLNTMFNPEYRIDNVLTFKPKTSGLYIHGSHAFTNVSRIHLDKCYFNGSTMNGIYMEGTSHVQITNSKISNNALIGIYLLNIGPGFFSLNNSTAKNNGHHAVKMMYTANNAGRTQPFYFELIGNTFTAHTSTWRAFEEPLVYIFVNYLNPTSWKIENNNFVNSRNRGMIIALINNLNNHSIDIVNNTFERMLNPALEVRCTYKHENVHINIIQNTFINNSKMTYYNWPVFRLSSDGKFQVNSTVRIHQNIIHDNTAVSAIYLEGEWGQNNVVVSDNIVKNNTITSTVELNMYGVLMVKNVFINPEAPLELKSLAFDDDRSNNITLNYWGYTSLTDVLSRLLIFDSNMAQAFTYYIPYRISEDTDELVNGRQTNFYLDGINGGEIESDITVANSPFVISRSIYIRTNGKLRIMSGTELTFKNNTGIYSNGIFEIFDTNGLRTRLTGCNGSTWHGMTFVDSIRQKHTDIRFINGSGPNNGRVEILHDGKWGTICGNRFDENEAKVICRMLGFDPSNGVSVQGVDEYGQGTGPIWMTNLECDGTEEHIKYCKGMRQWGNTNCGHSRDKGVSCSGAVLPSDNAKQYSILKNTDIIGTRVGVHVNGNGVMFSNNVISGSKENCLTLSSSVRQFDLSGTILNNCTQHGISVEDKGGDLRLGNVTINNTGVAGIQAHVPFGTVSFENLTVINSSEKAIDLEFGTSSCNLYMYNFFMKNSTLKNNKVAMQFDIYNCGWEMIFEVIENTFKNNVKNLDFDVSGYGYNQAQRKIMFAKNTFEETGILDLRLKNAINFTFEDNIITKAIPNEKCFLSVLINGDYTSLYQGNYHIVGNVFQDSQADCVVSLTTNPLTVKFNGLFAYNSLLNNKGRTYAIELGTEHYTFSYNIFDNPFVTYDMKVVKRAIGVIDAKENWWGTTNLEDAKRRVFHMNQDTDLLAVEIEPILKDRNFDCSGISNCSDKGDCVRPDVCRCHSGWTGSNCSLFDCAGVNQCSGNGKCVGSNVCRCNDKWTGDQCVLPTCFGVNNCSNRGICVTPDQCSCFIQFADANCSTCAPNRWGPTCYLCPPCKNGVCDITNGQCLCRGINWAGDLCDRCNETFYGPTCLPLITVLAVSPSAGPDTGGTLVNVRGHNFPETADSSFFCKFGNTVVMGNRISKQLITCESPKHTNQIVRVEISANNTDYTHNGVEYFFYAKCPENACGSNETPPRGQCMFGGCSCFLPWTGSDCSQEILKPTVGDFAAHQYAVESDPYSYQLNLTEGTQPVSWYLVKGPSGMMLDDRTGLVTWERVVASIEPHSIIVKVRNVIAQVTVSWTLSVSLSYNATVLQVVPNGILDSPASVRISGTIYNFDGNNNRAAYVDVRIRNKGKTHNIPVFSLPRRLQFETVYYPRTGDSGIFYVDARHPSDAQFKEQMRWSVRGMSCSPGQKAVQAYLDQPVVIFSNIGTLQNTGDDVITDIFVELQGIGYPIVEANVTTEAALDSLSTGKSVSYNLTMKADGPLRGTIFIVFKSKTGTFTRQSVYLTLNVRRPLLVLSPSYLTDNVLRGSQKTFEINVTNVGEVNARNVIADLPADSRLSMIAFSGEQLATNGSLSIAPHSSAMLTLMITSSKQDSLGEMQGTIAINTDLTYKTLRYKLYITSLQKVNMSVRVEDEYTYFAEGNPLVSDATVLFSNPRRQYTDRRYTTNETEVVVFEDLFEDQYTVSAEAPGHGTYNAIIIVKQSETLRIFLPRIAVTYSWTVTPTTFQDTYTVTLDATFETQVPMPVVTIDPSNVNLIPYEEGIKNSIEFLITNHGLISAENVRFDLPTNHETLIFKQTISDIGNLPANTSIVIPIEVSLRTRKKRNAATDIICGLLMLYDFICGGLQTRMSEVTLSRQQPGRPPIPCGNTDGSSSSNNPTTPGGVSGTGTGDGGRSSGSYTTYNPVTPLSCDCIKSLIKSCSLAFHPVAGCAMAIADYGSSFAESDIILRTLKAIKAVADTFMGCVSDIICSRVGIPCSEIYTSIQCYIDIQHTCDKSRRQREASTEVTNQFIDSTKPIGNILDAINVIFDDEEFFDVPNQKEWYSRFEKTIAESSDKGTLLTTAEVNDVVMPLNNTQHVEIITRFLRRWNNTAAAWENGTLDTLENSQNFINTKKFKPFAEQYLKDTKVAGDKGFPSIFDYFDSSLNIYKNAEKADSEKDDGVCAKVRVRIQQELVLTRDAFNAKLEIDNGDNSPLEEIKVTIEIRETYGTGELVMSQFALGAASLSGLTGVDGNGRLEKDTSGSAEWLIVPYPSSAIKGDTLYDVGGRLSYRVRGSNFSLPLLPDTITVKPNPSLLVNYFHDKYVRGDNPMTANIKEPVVPFSLAVMIKNAGYGIARALKISSAQPEIIENEKGLLVSFKIIGAQLGDDPINPTLTVDFGDIQPFSTKVARWLLTSSLKGKFYNYSATFENINPLGDPQLSVLDELGYHDLIHLVRIDTPGDDDSLDDFLVNDMIDDEELPDRLYNSSDGTDVPVLQGNITDFSLWRTETRTKKVYKHINITVTIREHGWSYSRIENNITSYAPITGDIILSIVRSDGRVVISDKNAWITDYFMDKKFFHLFDYYNISDSAHTDFHYSAVFGKVNMYAPVLNETVYNKHFEYVPQIGITPLFTLAAIDSDGDNVLFNLQANAMFSVEPVTGVVTAKQALLYEHEYEIKAILTDDGIPAKSTEKSIKIIITIGNTTQPTTQITTSPGRITTDDRGITETASTGTSTPGLATTQGTTNDSIATSQTASTASYAMTKTTTTVSVPNTVTTSSDLVVTTVANTTSSGTTNAVGSTNSGLLTTETQTTVDHNDTSSNGSSSIPEPISTSTVKNSTGITSSMDSTNTSSVTTDLLTHTTTSGTTPSKNETVISAAEITHSVWYIYISIVSIYYHVINL